MKKIEEYLSDNKTLSLSRYIVRRSNQMGIVITHLKLQKILYYIQGMFLAQFKRSAFPDTIEAWQYGPVVRNVYSYYCYNGALPLIEKEDIDLSCYYSNEERELIDNVINQKLSMSARDLVRATHEEEPWKRHADHIEEKPVISIEEMQQYFERIY